MTLIIWFTSTIYTNIHDEYKNIHILKNKNTFKI